MTKYFCKKIAFLVIFLNFAMLILRCTGVSGHINAFYLLKSGVRVNLSSTERCMAQQFLNRAYIRSVIQHRRSERVPKHVRRVFLERTNFPHMRAHDSI